MSAAVRRAITGALFGTTGTLIALSPLGRISGAHINPAVSLAFWISGKLRWRDMVGYGSAQFAGALLGACTLLARGSARCKRALWRDNGWDECQYRPGAGWGNCRHSRADPGHFCDLCHRSTRQLTPWTMRRYLHGWLWWEAPLSGASANPARSFGPQ